MSSAIHDHAGTVLVGVDGSRSAARALMWAVDQAGAEGRALTLVHAVPPLAAAWLDPAGADHRVGVDPEATAGHEVLRLAHRAATERAPGLAVREVLRVADPRDLLLSMSAQAALVVLGSRGRGPVRSLLLGSVGAALSRHAECPVVVHRPTHPGTVRHGVLVGVDGTPDSLPALEFAFRQASLHGWPLTVLHAFWDVQAAVAGPHRVDARSAELEQERLLVSESVSGMGEKFPDVHVTKELARGLAADCLVRAGARMNLIVVGSRTGGTASPSFHRSVALAVVEHATSTVAVVPGEGGGRHVAP